MYDWDWLALAALATAGAFLFLWWLDGWLNGGPDDDDDAL